MARIRHSVDPRCLSLFDAFAGVFSPLARRRLEKGWPAIFRAVLLELMPARSLGEHCRPTQGRPAKELSSVSNPAPTNAATAPSNAIATSSATTAGPAGASSAGPEAPRFSRGRNSPPRRWPGRTKSPVLTRQAT